MTASALLDTNVLLRHILKDRPDHSPRSTALVDRIAAELTVVRLADTVILETIFVLTIFYRVPRVRIRDSLLPLIELPGMVLPDKDIYPEVFDRWVAEPPLSFADSHHLSLTKHLGLSQIISFDRKIAKDPAVTRVEP